MEIPRYEDLRTRGARTRRSIITGREHIDIRSKSRAIIHSQDSRNVQPEGDKDARKRGALRKDKVYLDKHVTKRIREYEKRI